MTDGVQEAMYLHIPAFARGFDRHTGGTHRATWGVVCNLDHPGALGYQTGMAKPGNCAGNERSAREARLKSALKANLARRKLQARERSRAGNDTAPKAAQTGEKPASEE